MRPALTFEVAPVELVQSLIRDGAALLGAEQPGDVTGQLKSGQ